VSYKELKCHLEVPMNKLTKDELETSLNIFNTISEGVWNETLEPWKVRAIVKLMVEIYNHWEDEPQEPRDAYDILREAFSVINGGKND
jgi:hypothetical protein